MKVLSGDVIGLGHSDVDICDMDSVTDILQRIQPHRVINAAAYNKVDQAEDEPHIAWQVNALGHAIWRLPANQSAPRWSTSALTTCLAVTSRG